MRPGDGEGISILGQEPVEVVMTDQRMPNDGGELRTRAAKPIRTSPPPLTGTRHSARWRRHNRGTSTVHHQALGASELQGIIRDAVERHELIAERRGCSQLQRKNEELMRAYSLSSPTPSPQVDIFIQGEQLIKHALAI